MLIAALSVTASNWKQPNAYIIKWHIIQYNTIKKKEQKEQMTDTCTTLVSEA